MLRVAVLVGIVLGSHAALAAERFFAFNETTATDFTGVYLAPAGTTTWGPNQALNDKDKSLDHGERLALTGIGHGRYDVRLVDSKGHECRKAGVDLTKDTGFDIRDADLAACH